MKIPSNANLICFWREVIQEAEVAATISLADNVESYLVFLMMRYANQPDVLKQILSTEFLKGIKLPKYQRELMLQGVGDKCLLYTGLFPFIAEKRLVKISYFVRLGQSAYSMISKDDSDVYAALALHFVPMMDVLQSIRHYSKDYPDLFPLTAYQLWIETGSLRAYSLMQQDENKSHHSL